MIQAIRFRALLATCAPNAQSLAGDNSSDSAKADAGLTSVSPPSMAQSRNENSAMSRQDQLYKTAAGRTATRGAAAVLTGPQHRTPSHMHSHLSHARQVIVTQCHCFIPAACLTAHGMPWARLQALTARLAAWLCWLGLPQPAAPALAAAQQHDRGSSSTISFG